ncbi:copper homeostasis periplasmic binding protein CopC [Pantoea eucrina]|uniref:Copper resistance protein C n=1 Tax=Pantoea eucrina TaxID=472693 RepID=A0ABU5LE25_9GAMM|nr:copper homeostasis periplasmic binding protein CopC [Pantoea eucrina]MDZ7278190.1 copper homeostasis periplasmic binding protein CopC [Pantoea eucrina]
MNKKAIFRAGALMLTTFSLLFSGLALAHAHLKTPSPADNAQLTSSPTSLTLTFSEDIEPAFSGVELLNDHQQPVALKKAAVNPEQPAQLIVPLSQPLVAGEYHVKWHVLSVDGHKTQGSYRFSVK